jgi:hypothetical protein
MVSPDGRFAGDPTRHHRLDGTLDTLIGLSHRSEGRCMGNIPIRAVQRLLEIAEFRAMFRQCDANRRQQFAVRRTFAASLLPRLEHPGHRKERGIVLRGKEPQQHSQHQKKLDDHHQSEPNQLSAPSESLRIDTRRERYVPQLYLALRWEPNTRLCRLNLQNSATAFHLKTVESTLSEKTTSTHRHPICKLR